MLLLPAPPLKAENSPNNGAYYDIKKGNIYYELKKANSVTRYDRYVVVDADYTDSLVIDDYIEGLPVDYVYNMAGRTDLEYVSLGSQVKNASFKGCTYLSEIDLSRINVSGSSVDISGSDVTKLEVPAMTISATNCESLTEVVFTGKGTGSFGYCSKLASLTLHEDMTQVPYLRGCSELQSIHIPAGVKIINANIFNGCSKLSAVTFAEGSQLQQIMEYAFSGTALRSFDCPPGVEKIGECAFGSTPIEAFVLPASYSTSSSVPGKIFRDCYSLCKIDYPNPEILLAMSPAFSEEDSHYKPFEKNVELTVGGKLLTEIVIPLSAPNTDFTRTTGLRNITIENANTRKTHRFASIPTLEEVNVGAGDIYIYCARCTNLKTVNVSSKNRATYLPGFGSTDGFEGCTSLESIYFPNVEEIWDRAFKGCTALKKIDFPKVKEIGQSVFEGCTALTDVHLPVLENFTYSGSFKNCTSLETISLPELSAFDTGTFEGCTSLVTVESPKATTIGERCFKGCSNLAQFDFESLTMIAAEAFMGTAFTDVSVPLTCNVRSNAFSSCPSLRRLSVPVTGTLNIKDLPVAEDLIFYASADGNLNINNCFTESEGNITVNGSISDLDIAGAPGLNRLSVMGAVTRDFYLSINTVPKEFEVRSIEEYLGWKFRNGAFTPGYFADGPGLIDLYVNGQPVKDLLLPPGSIVPNFAFNKFNIESVTIGGFKTDPPTTINASSFYNCTNLKKLNVYGNLTYIGTDAFRSTGLETVELPSTLLNIGTGSFAYCKQLRHITFPESLTTLPNGTVFGCEQLESLIIPEGVTYCGFQIASGTMNKGLKTISLPSTLEAVSRVNRPSFEDFTHNLEFLSWALVAPAANFDNFTGFTVHVPQGAGQNYKNKAAWTNAEIIDDLLVGNMATVSGDEVVIYVPKQNAVSERATVTTYTVDCYNADNDDRTEPELTFTFDAAGPHKISPASTAGGDWQELHLTGLQPHTRYEINVKGYTASNDMIYKHAQTVSTDASGIESTLVSEEITLHLNTLHVPAKYAGENLGIYTIGGTQVLSTIIREHGSEIHLELDHGVYILQCGETTLKVKL